MLTESERTSYHEAVHAVAAYHAPRLRSRILLVRTGPEPGCGGLYYQPFEPAAVSDLLVCDAVRVLLAGPIGEWVFTGAPGGLEVDARKAAELLNACGTPPGDGLLDGLTASVELLVRGHAGAVERVASWLLTCGSLDAEQLAHAIETTPRRTRFPGDAADLDLIARAGADPSLGSAIGRLLEASAR